MFFKRLLNTILLVTCASTLFACSLKIHDPPVAQPVIAVNPLSGGCLANAGNVFKTFFNGQISAADLDNFWGCMDKTFRTFMNNTKGAHDGYYTSEELRIFVEKYFLKAPISQGFMNEAMVLKQSLLGGRTDQVTEAELNSILRILAVFRTQTGVIRPYLPFGPATLTHKVLAPDDFEAAVEAINQATGKIGEVLQSSVGTYSFDHLDSFIDELGILFYGMPTKDQDGTWVDDAKRYAKVLRYIKSILISPPADAIQTSDWQKVFYLVPRYFTLYVRAGYYMSSDQSMTYGPGLRRMNSMASDLRNLLEQSIKNHPVGYISYIEMNSLLNVMQKYDLLPAPLEATTIQPLLPIFFNKIFQTGNPSVNPDLGINVGTIDRMYDDFNNWSEGQFYLEGVFKNLAGADHFLDKELGRYDILTIVPDVAIQWTVLKNDISLAAIKDLQHEVSAVNLHFPIDNTKSTVQIPLGKPIQTYSFNHLTKVNMFRAVNQLLIRGYAVDPVRVTTNPSLTKSEVNQLWGDFFPLAAQLKFLTADSKTSASAYVLEADMFTYAANGNGNLDLDEAIELEALLLSTATKAKENHHAMLALCGSVGQSANGEGTIDPTCFRQKFIAGSLTYWDYIPGFTKAFQSLTPAQKASMMQTFDALAKRTDANAPYQLADSQAYVLIPYYIEILYSKFDTNVDGIITETEAQPAFPIFKEFLRGKVSAAESFLNSDQDVLSVFMYMLHYGLAPNDSFGEEVRFAWWRYLDWSTWTCKTERATIATIFYKLLNFK